MTSITPQPIATRSAVRGARRSAAASASGRFGQPRRPTTKPTRMPVAICTKNEAYMKRPNGERQLQLKTRAVSRIASRNEPRP